MTILWLDADRVSVDWVIECVDISTGTPFPTDTSNTSTKPLPVCAYTNSCTPDADPCLFNRATCGGGGDGGPIVADTSKEPSDTLCATQDPVLDAAGVQGWFRTLWSQSNYKINGVIQPAQDRQEVGGWIILTNGVYSFQPFPVAWSSVCGIDSPDLVQIPAGAVAWIHTHPYKLGDKMTGCEDALVPIGNGSVYSNYVGASTQDDNDLAAHFPGLAAYFIDADHIAKFTADASQPDTNYGRCGF